VSGASRLEGALRGPRKGLVAYVTAGDPSQAATVDVVCACAAGGADVIELGVPFSDPSADGPVIQRAMQRALGAGGSLVRTLETVAAVRKRGVNTPIVLFGYFNPFYIRGLERAVGEAMDAGADGMLVVDLPPEEGAELHVPLRAAGLGVVPLIAPTSTPARIAAAAAAASGFVYYVALLGVTGAALGAGALGELGGRVAAIRAATSLPIAVGFGVSGPEDAARVAEHADAVVVGSAIVRAVEEHAASPGPAVECLVAGLRAALS